MSSAFLDLNDILILLVIGFVLGLPSGWILFNYLADIRDFLVYHLVVKNQYREVGSLQQLAAAGAAREKEQRRERERVQEEALPDEEEPAEQDILELADTLETGSVIVGGSVAYSVSELDTDITEHPAAPAADAEAVNAGKSKL